MRSTPGSLARTVALVAGTTVLALGSALAVLAVMAGPADAAPGPTSGLAASLAPHGLLLTWTASGHGAPIVRDVTGEQGPSYDPSGPALTASPTPDCPVATCLYDGSFTNTASRTFAVWATDDGTPATASSSADVHAFGPLPAVPTDVSAQVSQDAVDYGTTLTVTGTVTRAGAPFPGASVSVVSQVLGGAQSVLARLTSAADGTVRFGYVPDRSRDYQLVVDGDAFSAGSASPRLTVAMAPRVTARFVAGVVPWRTPAVLTGRVAPALSGQRVAVQRWNGSAWATIGNRPLSAASAYSVPVVAGVGSYRYRVVLAGAVDHAPGVSGVAPLTVTPRTLRWGMSGPDVLSLERRMAALRYDVGRVDGVFDESTLHAVIAFQKVERMPRTGRWGTAERARALHPHAFHARYRDARLTVEVDITRQVVVLVRNGVVLTIVDASTGSEHVYYQDGARNIAHTPRGVFSIFFKVDGIRISELGELYRPSYFFKGWAIHGNGSVPSFPASHGCVRIPNPAADRLFLTLAIGTRVAVYDE